ncbi:hypothetical protein ABEB36_012189 [Hypothenemus hampei]|uniref:Uncharacterized protein n=1 Tax=Hypothenemus hampei TaxID=57062 RepID=A0ABD1EAE9_HYPHA
MEAVKAFNSELSSLYEVKPPISKAKMTALTRGAIKAIKFYKHVVQSVEKFILKCKPEYKVPGLYVIDSIVRQSRHQFGPEKDVFAPRFSKNLQQTFVNLFKCPAEDKSKIIRVLNLWQKNQVFPPEDIQPLFDLADPSNPIYQQLQQQSTPVQQTNGAQGQVIKGSPALQRTPTKVNQAATSEVPASNLNLTEPVLQQLQQLQRLLTKGADAGRAEVHFDKKLLDFDYGDDEEEVNPSPRPPAAVQAPGDPVANLLTNPEVLRQLQTLQNTLAGAVNAPVQDLDADRLRKLQEMKMQEDEFDKHLAQTVPNLPFAAECDFKLAQSHAGPPGLVGGLIGGFMQSQPEPSQISQGNDHQHENSTTYATQNNADVEVITLDHDDSYSDDDRYKRKRSRSKSRDRGRDKDRRRRSRSRSRSRGRRYRSKSRDRRDKDRKEREKESERDKERKKRGLPVMKSNNLSVCSTTLWVGHLSKLVHQDDLSNTFGEFGDIVSIDLINPRGCAFIVMHRRQDAARCLTKLKNYNLNGKAITLAWAPGKGVKGKDLKDYWEGDLGVSYIPWTKLREDMDLEALEDGGMIDEDTMPDWMKRKMEQSTMKTAPPDQPTYVMSVGEASNQSTPTVDTSQPPPLHPSGLMQPPPVLPMVSPFQLNNRFLSMIPNLANLPLGVPPPNLPPTMMGLGMGSPFQAPPGFLPTQLPPQETKPTTVPPPPTTTDAKLRNLGESLMNLAGQTLPLPPQMNQPPPPLQQHISIDDNMDIEMEDAGHTDINVPPPNIPLSEQLQSSMNFGRFSPSKRDRRDRSNERGRRRSRSRERDRNGRDRRDRDRDRDFGRGVRDRDRRGERNRWAPGDRHRNGRRDENERKDASYDRRRDNDTRDKNDREKTLNERLKEMAGIKFDEPGQSEQQNTSPRSRRLSDSRDVSNKDSIRFENSTTDGVLIPNPIESANSNPPQDYNNAINEGILPPNEILSNNPPQNPEFELIPPEDNRPGMELIQFNDVDRFGNYQVFDQGAFGYDRNFEESPYGPEFEDSYNDGLGGRFGTESNPHFRGYDDYGPPDMMMDGPPGFGSDFGPLDRFSRGGMRRGRGRGRGRGRDGPDFFPRDDYGPPMMDDDFGLPMRNDFQRGDEFGPRGGRMRGRGFFRGVPRGSFRDGPPGGFKPEFDHPPEFFRSGPRGRPFGEPFARNRGRGGFRGRGGRGSDFSDGGPPGVPFETGVIIEEIGSDTQCDAVGDFDDRHKKKGKLSRWENEGKGEPSESEGQFPISGGDGGGTPLRDELDDCRAQPEFAVSEKPDVLENVEVSHGEETQNSRTPGAEVPPVTADDDKTMDD